MSDKVLTTEELNELPKWSVVDAVGLFPERDRTRFIKCDDGMWTGDIARESFELKDAVLVTSEPLKPAPAPEVPTEPGTWFTAELVGAFGRHVVRAAKGDYGFYLMAYSNDGEPGEAVGRHKIVADSVQIFDPFAPSQEEPKNLSSIVLVEDDADLPAGTVVLDRDGDEWTKGADGKWFECNCGDCGEDLEWVIEKWGPVTLK